MLECPRGAPWHGEHEVYWNPQGLCTVYMGKTWRVCNDGVCHKRGCGHGIVFDTGVPAPFQHFCNHRSLTLDISSSQTLHFGDQAGVLDHVRHEVRRITTDWVEFQASVLDKGMKDIMSG